MPTPMISARGIVNRFGTPGGARRHQPRRHARRNPRHRRRLGIRQVRAAEDARRPAPAGRRRRCSSNGKPIEAVGAGGAGVADRRAVPAGRAVLVAVGRAEHHAADARAHRPARAGAGADRGDEARAGRHAGRHRPQVSVRSSPAAWSSAPRSRARSRSTRRSSFSTSRRPTSTRSTASGIDALIGKLNRGPGRHRRHRHARPHDAVHAVRPRRRAGRREGHGRHRWTS